MPERRTDVLVAGGGSAASPRRRRRPAAGKAIGTTHITNGALRLHSVEWNAGEAAIERERTQTRAQAGR